MWILKNKYVVGLLYSWVWYPWIQPTVFSICSWESVNVEGQLYILFYIILYKWLERLQILVSGGVLEPNPLWIPGDDYLSFGGVKSICGFSIVVFIAKLSDQIAIATIISPFHLSLSFMLTTRLYVDDSSHFGFLKLVLWWTGKTHQNNNSLSLYILVIVVCVLYIWRSAFLDIKFLAHIYKYLTCVTLLSSVLKTGCWKFW